MPFSPFQWNFAIDRYLNPFIPPSVLPRVPYAISHFFGYRRRPPTRPPVGNFVIIVWGFIGIFCSLSIIGAVQQHIPSFVDRAVPTMIGSFGAAAVLDFYAIESPLAQPRNTFFGQLISSILGISICKLCALSPHFESVRWLAAALACATASAAMCLTNTIHPPAGATALMAVADPDVARLGWFLIPAVMLGCCFMTSVALLVNNAQRRFPFYWWSPEVTGRFWSRWDDERGEEVEGEGADADAATNSLESKETAVGAGGGDVEAGAAHLEEKGGCDGVVVVGRGGVRIPAGLLLTLEERRVLEGLSLRL
ncbi:HPP family-domain-containing protein [Podospora appendiculata]|uniref:HPP family-domain-containing protein n=1 Tax=Podospora appendiculata TaxID=314037 RepID=A0AAE0WZ65_9PEZI|nr:HPP family-domain-containing protein [Podospora appendiculata]